MRRLKKHFVSIHFIVILMVCLLIFSLTVHENVYAASLNSENTMAGSEEKDPEEFEAVEKSARMGQEQSVSLMSDDGKVVGSLGVDVYSGDGTIDWKKVKADGIDFAFIRVGYRGWGYAGTLCKDTSMAYNIQNAKNAGIKVGVYFYATAVSVDEAKAEASFVLSLLNGIDLDYPVCYDYEGYDISYYRNYNISPASRTQFAIAFLDAIEAAGYKGLMYGSSGHLRNNNEWNTDQLEDKYDIWVAQYWLNGNGEEYHDIESAKYRETSYTGKYRFWQCSSQGVVDGISHYADIDIEYTDAAEESLASSAATKEETAPESSLITLASTTVSSDNTATEASKSGSGISNTKTQTYVSLGDVNYRNKPGFSGSVQGTIPKGEKVSVYTGYIKVSGGYTWYKIKYKGETVYAAACYFRPRTMQNVKYKSYKTRKAVDYRSMPTSYSKCVGRLVKGKKIKVVTGYSVKAGGKIWYMFKYRGNYYYITAASLK